MPVDIGQYVPKPFFKKVSLERSLTNDRMMITVDVVLKQSARLRWAFNGKKNKLRLHIIRITDQHVFNKYASQRAALIGEISTPSTSGNKSQQDMEVRSINISDLVTNLNSSYVDKKTKTQNFLYTETFKIAEGSPKDLTFLAVVCYDMHWRLSEVAAEIVIENGAIKETAQVSTNSANPTLSEEEIGQTTINTTVQDFTEIERIKNLKISNDVLQKSVFHPPGKRLHTGDNRKPKNAYFSDINLALDVQGNCRFHFSINWAEAILHEGQFARLVASEGGRDGPSLNYERPAFQKVLNLSRIKSITIKRRRVDYRDKDNRSSLMRSFVPNTEMRTFADNKEEVIAHSRDIGASISSNSLVRTESNLAEEKTLKSIGTISELNELFISPTTNTKGKTISPLQYRHFTGIDFSMAEINDGEYQYSVEYEIKDGSIEYLNEIIDRLKIEIKNLEDYHNHILLSANSSSKFNIVSNNFINMQDLDLSLVIQKGHGPWQRMPALLAEIVSTFRNFGSGSPSSQLQQSLYLMSSPYNGSIKGISMLIDAGSSVLNKLQNMLNVNLRRTNKGSEAKPSAGSGNRPPMNSFVIKHDFEDSIDVYEYKNMGYEYIGQDRLNSAKGLQGISLLNYKNRTKEETLKYFSLSNTSDDNVLMAGTNFEDSTSTTEMSYLTPRRIRSSSGVHEMYTLDRSNNNRVTATPDLNTVKIVADIINYKNFGYIPTVDVAPEENARSTNNTRGEDNVAHPKNKQITNKLLDSLSTSNLTVEAHDFRPTAEGSRILSSLLIDQVMAEDEIEKRDILGPSIAKRSDSEAESAPENTATTARNEIPPQTHINNIAAPLTYIKHLNILGENNRLKTFNADSPAFNYSSAANRGLLPNHFKSLIADSAGDITVNQNLLSTINTIESTAFFILHYKTLATVEALIGFENGNLKQPIWRRLGPIILGYITVPKNILCRLVPYSSAQQSVQGAGRVNLEIIDLPIYNQYFLLNVADTTLQATHAFQPAKIKFQEISEALEADSRLKIDNEFVYTKVVSSRFPVELPPPARMLKATKTKTRSRGPN